MSCGVTSGNVGGFDSGSAGLGFASGGLTRFARSWPWGSSWGWSTWDRRSCLRSVLVETRLSEVGDPEAGWFLTDAGRCAVIDQSVECICQGAVVEPEPCGSLQILERHTGSLLRRGFQRQSMFQETGAQSFSSAFLIRSEGRVPGGCIPSQPKTRLVRSEASDRVLRVRPLQGG